MRLDCCLTAVFLVLVVRAVLLGIAPLGQGDTAVIAAPLAGRATLLCKPQPRVGPAVHGEIALYGWHNGSGHIAVCNVQAPAL